MTAAPSMTEAQLQAAVVEAAEMFRWRWMHIRPSVQANNNRWATSVNAEGVGWPDLFLVKGSRALGLELKRQSGKLTPDQQDWLQRLNAAGIDARVVRPSELNTIIDLLASPEPHAQP